MSSTILVLLRSESCLKWLSRAGNELNGYFKGVVSQNMIKATNRIFWLSQLGSYIVWKDKIGALLLTTTGRHIGSINAYIVVHLYRCHDV